MKTKTYWVKLALVVLTLLFIWGNSLVPGELSGAESGFVLRLVYPVVTGLQRVLERLGLAYSAAYLVRKLAHFTEYALLGVLMTALFIRPGLRLRLPMPVLLCLCAAAADETIQMFVAGRGPSFSDVALDFCGALCGVILFALAIVLIRWLRKEDGQ